MDVTIQINIPPLQVGETFKVRYREYPSGVFSATQLETNAPFTLTGLTAGEYELEVILDKGDIDCPAVLKRFTVVDPFTCLTFTGETQTLSNGLHQVQLTYGAVVSNPPCGWYIVISGNNNNKTITYPTLPASPLNIPINNGAVTVQVYADLCNGNLETCYEADLAAPPVSCTPMVVNNVEITWDNNPNNVLAFTVHFDITQSTPYTSQALVNVTQTNTISMGAGLPGQSNYGSFNPYLLGINQIAFSVPINVNSAVGGVDTYTFSWYIIDRCGVKHSGTLFIGVP